MVIGAVSLAACGSGDSTDGSSSRIVTYGVGYGYGYGSDLLKGTYAGEEEDVEEVIGACGDGIDYERDRLYRSNSLTPVQGNVPITSEETEACNALKEKIGKDPDSALDAYEQGCSDALRRTRRLRVGEREGDRRQTTSLSPCPPTTSVQQARQSDLGPERSPVALYPDGRGLARRKGCATFRKRVAEAHQAWSPGPIMAPGFEHRSKDPTRQPAAPRVAVASCAAVPAPTSRTEEPGWSGRTWKLRACR